MFKLRDGTKNCTFKTWKNAKWWEGLWIELFDLYHSLWMACQVQKRLPMTHRRSKRAGSEKTIYQNNIECIFWLKRLYTPCICSPQCNFSKTCVRSYQTIIWRTRPILNVQHYSALKSVPIIQHPNIADSGLHCT